MTTRWFFSSALVGAAASATGRRLPTSVTFTRTTGAGTATEELRGPTLSLVGPGDVLGFDPATVLRSEPPSSAAPAAENILASIEFAHADLPWLLSPGSAPTPSGPTPQPWLVLVVLSEDEAAAPRPANPLPILTAPIAALPPLAQRWAWAHVEARLPDTVTDAEAARRIVEQRVRQPGADVVARLVCPRRLGPDQGWIAAVVPATEGGRATGLDAAPTGPAEADAWPAAGAGSVELPVYHWWRFRTGKAGTFEELARRLEFRPADDAGLGSRTIDVTHPWPGEPPGPPATTALDGALRVPGQTGPEAWSDRGAQAAFREKLRERLGQPAQRRGRPGPVGGEDVPAVAPPLLGGRHTGEPALPANEDSWLTTLNLEVRRRVAAALGARYVQLEQEFLMARAWEQVGEIREANRLLAVAELASAAAQRAQHKHLDPLDVADLLTVMAPAGDRLRVSSASAGLVNAPTTLATALAKSRVPTGTVSSTFARLTRRGGALARRASRGEPAREDADGSVVQRGLLATSMLAAGELGLGLPGEVRSVLAPVPLLLHRMADRIPVASMARQPDDVRPLGPIMAHPRFGVPIAEELLARWPEWAIPGIGALPPESVTLLETNPEFVAAVLVGLNEEFNRELLWREFPTDQRGTPFARFWPTAGADVDEIARWRVDAPLGSHLRASGEGSLALLVRGELLRRFPGTPLLAVRGEGGRLPAAFGGLPATPLALDESTVLYLVDGVSKADAVAQDWFFVFREPMRGTQFGFDTGPQPQEMKTWADLTWQGVRVAEGEFVRVDRPPAGVPGQVDPPVWGRDAADMARIAYQQPFQLAFRAVTLLGA